MVHLFPHQEKAVAQLGNGKVLWGDVGTGKTLTAMAYYMANEAPKDVYVLTTAKKRDALDWPEDAAKVGVSTHPGIGNGGKLTVDSWNNIHKYLNVKDAFFIFDEQRLVGTGSWVKSFYKIAKANNWIMLTATPGDTWLDYAPLFIANGMYKNITEFRNTHVIYSFYGGIPKVQRYIGTGRLVRQRNSLLVEMPYMRHTKRFVTDIECDYDRDLFEQVVKKRWHVFEDRPLRDVAELFRVMRKVVNSDESRTKAIESLLSRHHKLIVFYNFDYELEALRELAYDFETAQTPNECMSSIQTREKPTHRSLVTGTTTLSPIETSSSEAGKSTGDSPPITSTSTKSSSQSSRASFAVAEYNGHKHEPIPTADGWLYLVQYTAGAEGWNCVETDAMCFYSQNYSYKILHQCMGRIDRLNTPFKELHYYNLTSKSLIDRLIGQALSGKKTFNESASGVGKGL